MFLFKHEQQPWNIQWTLLLGFKDFTYTIQFDCRIATIEAILMILASFERGELQLLIDPKISQFGWTDGKLNGNWNGICDLLAAIKIDGNVCEWLRLFMF